jgi:hypothetical protein
MRRTPQLFVSDEFAVTDVDGEIRLRPLVGNKAVSLEQVALPSL